MPPGGSGGRSGATPTVKFDSATGVYMVKGKPWPVAARYTVQEHIGGGSYGDVCRATDNETGETVALKRIPDVLCCPMLAKRVLREVCIMRRLSHPLVIRLADVFTRKSSEAEGSLDLYIATEFATGGDMYRLRESLTAADVRLLIWQLLVATRYLHSCHVWHRDIKSENTLLLKDRTVKICDFGLSRSALGAAPVQEPRHVGAAANGSQRTRTASKKLQRQYTKMVVTPSYRAPEVVMSRGQYTSAIDIWSLGCIFWELLMRQMNPTRLGPPPRPLFGVRGEPVTPERGELYVEDGASKLADQLNVIFDVIGTPCWKDIESVPGDAWRDYLKKLPGRAGNLATQMAGSGDKEALDLLTRMLAFDPSRRCTANEALAHTYFRDLRKPPQLAGEGGGNPCGRASKKGGQGEEQGGEEEDEDEEVRPVTLPTDQHFWQVTDPAVALGLLERELEQSTLEPDGGRQRLQWLLEREAEGQQLQNYLRNSLMRSLAASNLSPAAALSQISRAPPDSPEGGAGGPAATQRLAAALLPNSSAPKNLLLQLQKRKQRQQQQQHQQQQQQQPPPPQQQQPLEQQQVPVQPSYLQQQEGGQDTAQTAQLMQQEQQQQPQELLPLQNHHAAVQQDARALTAQQQQQHQQQQQQLQQQLQVQQSEALLRGVEEAGMEAGIMGERETAGQGLARAQEQAQLQFPSARLGESPDLGLSFLQGNDALAALKQRQQEGVGTGANPAEGFPAMELAGAAGTSLLRPHAASVPSDQGLFFAPHEGLGAAVQQQQGGHSLPVMAGRPHGSQPQGLNQMQQFQHPQLGLKQQQGVALSSQQQGAILGQQPGFQPELQPELQPGLQPGLQSGFEPGLQAGLQAGLEPGLQAGFEPGLQQQDVLLGQQLVAEGLQRSLSREVYLQQSEARNSLELQMQLSHVLSQMQGQGQGQGQGVGVAVGGVGAGGEGVPSAPSAAAMVAATLAQADLRSRKSSLQTLIATLRRRQQEGAGAQQPRGQADGVPGGHSLVGAQGHAAARGGLAGGAGSGPSLFWDDAASTSGRGALELGGGGGEAPGHMGQRGRFPSLGAELGRRSQRGNSGRFGAMAAVAEAAILAVDGEGSEGGHRNAAEPDGVNPSFPRRSPRIRDPVAHLDIRPTKRQSSRR